MSGPLPLEPLKAAARALGFDACAVAPVSAEADDGFDAWLAAGHHAGMDWMARTRDLRQHIALRLPEARSVVVVAANHHSPRPPAPAVSGLVSRYAWGRDYHRALLKPLRRLAAAITDLAPGARTSLSIDSAPVRERAWAARAGLGWIGKNSLILRQDLGSWFFLATIATTAEFTPGAPVPDRCGTCTACMDACPTGAITAPRVVDSNRCIAYQTIENRGGIPDALARKMGGWVFGCDLCQEVCPWNRKTPDTERADFLPRPGAANPPLEQLAEGNAEWFDATFTGTPVRRAGLAGMKRNALLVLKNLENR